MEESALICIIIASAAWLVTTSVSWNEEYRFFPFSSAIFGGAAQAEFWTSGYTSMAPIVVIAICAVACMFTVPEIFLRR